MTNSQSHGRSPPVEQRPKPRISISRPVRLHYKRFDHFIEAVAQNISETGMFIATRRSRARGSHFHFSLSLTDGYALIEGLARVVWQRVDANGSPTGMGVEFLLLEGESRELVRRIVAENLADAERDPERVR